MHPVYPYFSPDFSYVDDLVGFVVAILPWDSYFTNVLPRVSTAWWLFSMTRAIPHQLDGPESSLEK
jgi:hypothetical protein